MIDHRVEWEKLKEIEGTLERVKSITPRNAGPQLAFFMHSRAMMFKLEHQLVFLEMLNESKLPGLSEKRRRQYRKRAIRYARRAGLLRQEKAGQYAFTNKELRRWHEARKSLARLG